MKKLFTSSILFSISIVLFAQEDLEKISDSLVAEGLTLYKSEMASWYGTDIFLEKHKEGKAIGGYFSYSEKSTAKCIFYSKEETPKVIGTITFDSSYKLSTAAIDLTEREFTNGENNLYLIRSAALETAKADTFFRYYKNTNPNFIPVISKGQKKVYILTGPKENGVVIFGNDYLLTFNEKNEIINKRRLHKNIIKINYGNKGKDSGVVAAMHSHLPESGEFITATDICTLMLYERFAKWENHYVISKDYVSLWNCDKNSLLILTKEAWDKIYADQKDR